MHESHEKKWQKSSFRGTSGRFSVPRYNKNNKKRKKDTLDVEYSRKKFTHAPKKTTVATQCAWMKPDFIISATHKPRKQINNLHQLLWKKVIQNLSLKGIMNHQSLAGNWNYLDSSKQVVKASSAKWFPGPFSPTGPQPPHRSHSSASFLDNLLSSDSHCPLRMDNHQVSHRSL